MSSPIVIVVDNFIPLPDITRVLPDGCEFRKGNLRTITENQELREEMNHGLRNSCSNPGPRAQLLHGRFIV